MVESSSENRRQQKEVLMADLFDLEQAMGKRGVTYLYRMSRTWISDVLLLNPASR